MKKDWMIKESELDDDQRNFLIETNDKSSVVAGCAGSGKSVLALIKAQRIQKEISDNYKVIVYTKALCEFMKSGKSELGLNNSFYDHYEWKNKYGKPSADYIIVDEIQDFNDEEINEFIQATNKKFFFFGDTAQSVYDKYKNGILPVKDIPRITPQRFGLKTFDLLYNYRLPLSVAKLVQNVGVDLPEFDEGIYKSQENAIPRILKYNDYTHQIKAIDNISKDKSDIAVLLPTNNSVKYLSEQMEKQSIKHEVRYYYDDEMGRKHRKYTLDFSTTLPKLMTYHSAKGLQFETVILPFLEQYFEQDKRDRKALYVAMTRTYKELYVLYSGSMPRILSQIPTNLYKTTEVDEIKDI